MCSMHNRGSTNTGKTSSVSAVPNPTEYKMSRNPVEIARNGYKFLGLDAYKKYFWSILAQDIFETYFLRQNLAL